MRAVDNETNKRYWVECIGYIGGEPVYKVRSGYYLGSYENRIERKHIVSDGDITSCVVRHISDGNLFTSHKQAYEKMLQLREEDNK